MNVADIITIALLVIVLLVSLRTRAHVRLLRRDLNAARKAQQRQWHRFYE